MTADEEHDSMVWHKENVVMIPCMALVVLLLIVACKAENPYIVMITMGGAWFFLWLGITFG